MEELERPEQEGGSPDEPRERNAPDPAEAGPVAVAPLDPEATAEPVEAPDAPAGGSVSMEEFLAEDAPDLGLKAVPLEDAELRAVLEALIYVAEEPLTMAQIAAGLDQPVESIAPLLAQLIAEFDRPEHGVNIREVAGGYKMATKPEHHEAVRSFVKSLKAPMKLSLPALETLAVVAYKQPVTAPEIMEIRGVQGAGVLKTLLDRKLIAVAGRKDVIGKPMLYKTTKEFLIQFGLKDLSELPSLKEFEEIRRMAFADSEIPPAPAAQPVETAAGPAPATAAAPAEVPGGSEAAPAESEALAEPAPTAAEAAPAETPAAPETPEE